MFCIMDFLFLNLLTQVVSAATLLLWECNDKESYYDTSNAVVRNGIFEIALWHVIAVSKKEEEYNHLFRDVVNNFGGKQSDIDNPVKLAFLYLENQFTKLQKEVDIISGEYEPINEHITQLSEGNNCLLHNTQKLKDFGDYEEKEEYIAYLDYTIHRAFVDHILEKFSGKEKETTEATKKIIQRTPEDLFIQELRKAFDALTNSNLYGYNFYMRGILNGFFVLPLLAKWVIEHVSPGTTIVFQKQYTDFYERMFDAYCVICENNKLGPKITADQDLLRKLRYLCKDNNDISALMELKKEMNRLRGTKLIILSKPDFFARYVFKKYRQQRSNGQPNKQIIIYKLLNEFDPIYDSIIRDIFAPKKDDSKLK